MDERLPRNHEKIASANISDSKLLYMHTKLQMEFILLEMTATRISPITTRNGTPDIEQVSPT